MLVHKELDHVCGKLIEAGDDLDAVEVSQLRRPLGECKSAPQISKLIGTAGEKEIDLECLRGRELFAERFSDVLIPRDVLSIDFEPLQARDAFIKPENRLQLGETTRVVFVTRADLVRLGDETARLLRLIEIQTASRSVDQLPGLELLLTAPAVFARKQFLDLRERHPFRAFCLAVARHAKGIR